MPTQPTDRPILSTDLRRPFGRTGLLVSPLGFGGAPIGSLETDGAIVGEILHTLLDHGVNLIDTAHVYYGSEESIGDAVGHRRDEYVLVSKCGSKFAKVPDEGLGEIWSPDYIRATIDRTLERLRADFIDVMLLHSCDLATLREGSAMGAIVEARDAGKVRFAGYSGDNEAAAWAAEQPDIAVIQTSVSVCDQRNIDVALPGMIRHDVGVMAKRPIANAAWKARGDQYEKYLPYAEPYHDRFEKLSLDRAAIRAACDDDALDWPEIALRFTLSIPGVHTAIVGTTNPRNLDGNLRAASKGPLPEAAVTIIREAYRAADPAGEWQGLT